jgi:cathepsin L
MLREAPQSVCYISFCILSHLTCTAVGPTIFADLTNEEYRTLTLGTRFDGTARLAAAQVVESPQANPASVNWVKAGAVTPIKNQGQCGSCWSFSTTGSVEGIHFIRKSMPSKSFCIVPTVSYLDNLVSLSEQNLMDCSTSYGNNGCNGGLMDQAFRYIVANGGIDTEASYPYTEATEPCKYKAANSGASITGFTDVTAGSESVLETAAVTQPISVAIDASHNSFQLYQSGVYVAIYLSP